MSTAVAKVSFLQGQAWAKAPDGSLRVLMVGSTLNDDEVVVTAQGARIELDVGTGDPLVVNGGQEVGMSRDFVADTATAADEALLSDASVQEALTVLDQGGDLLEELEEAAAGNAGGGGGDGHDFVQLTRIIENTDPLAFDFSQASQAGLGGVEDDADYINRAPLVTDQVIALNEDEPLTGQIIATDIENDALTFTLTTPPVNGTLVLDPVTGQFTFTPNANYNGSDGFVVTVTDSRGNSTNTSITLNIAPVNDAPTTNDINLTTDEDVPVNGQVVAQDIENDTLSYFVSGQPANGTVVLNPATGDFLYTPNSNYNGSDSFVVTVIDGNGGTTTSTVTIGVTPVNDAPVSSDLSLLTDEDVPVSGQIVATDVDGDFLGYTVSSQPINGTVVLDAATGGFTYSPNADYNGSDSFIVTISDGNGGTTTSTVTIGINPVNDAPVSSDQNLTTPEDTALAGQITATDVDGDTLGYVLSGQPTNGTVALNPATGGFIYTPSSNYNGSDSFVVTVSDGNGGTTTSIVNIGVTPVNDAPVSNNQNLTTPEDTALAGQITATDVDGDTLGYTLSSQPTNGTVALNPATGGFIYTPNSNYNGSDSFVVTVSDGNGGTTTSIVNIGVTPVNDAPVARNLNLKTDENIAVNGAIRANDPDGDRLTYSVSDSPANGSVTINPATGRFVYTPNTGYAGDDSFVVTVSDGKGGTTTSTVTIGVTPANDAPVAVAETINVAEGGTATVLVGGATSVLANDTDAENDPLTAILVTGPTNGTLTFDSVEGTFSYVHNGSETTSDSFSYKVNDGTVDGNTVTVTINVTPSAAVAPETNDVDSTGAEGSLITVNLSGSDSDGTVAGYVINSLPANGVLYSDELMTTEVVAGDLVSGPVYFMPNADWNGSTNFGYSARDNDGLTDTTEAQANIIVTPESDDAELGIGEGAVQEDTPSQTTAKGTLSIFDPDEGEAYFEEQSDTAGIYGSFSITRDGVWTYTLDNTKTEVQELKRGQSENETFIVKSIDGTTTAVMITVYGTNDDPIAVADSGTTLINSKLIFTAAELLDNDSDIDGDTLTIDSVQGAVNGSVIIDPVDGNVEFTPTPGYFGLASFTYTISDGQGGFSTATVNVTVNKINAVPVAVDDQALVQLNAGGTLGWGQSFIQAITATGGTLKLNGADAVAGAMGVVGRGNTTEVDDEIQNGEFITLTLDGPVLDASFGFAKLDFSGTPEIGLWIAYLDGVEVSRGQFQPTDATRAGTVQIKDANGKFVAFDQIRFDTASVGADYVVTSFNATRSKAMITEGATVEQTVAAGVLANDTDADAGDTLSVVGVRTGAELDTGVAGTIGVELLGTYGRLTLNENGSYTYVANHSNTLKAGEIVKDYFTYTVRDGQLGTDTATLTITVLGDGAINGSAGDDTPIKSNDSSASAPSLVVSKSLLAVAQGTEGTSVKFPIITRLVDTDGSESLSINVSGVPTGVTFNAGTNLGGGIWSFVAADLANLQLNLPGSFSTSASGTALSVSVTSTESNGGDTQTVSSTIRLLADYTTTTATTTENGNNTGSSADNHILGGSGSNTISGGSGNDLIYGGAGNDTLNGDASYDVLYGEAGNDTINGGDGSDRISGGADNDSLDGGTGNSVDVFAWTLGDQGTAGTPAEDTIYNFGTSAAGNNTNGGDVLDLRDLLQGESVGASNGAGNLANYLHFEVAGGDTIVHISHTGGFSGDSHTVGAGYTGSAETQKIVLSGVDLQSLYSGATTDQQIITQLLNNNKLITD